jgi:lipopolysaccharide assembly outer membrane protein LptD (OstA)
MKAVGNVFLVNSKGEQLNAEELIWDQNKKKIYSDKFVKVTTEDEIMFGNGFESNEDFSEYKVKKLTGQLKIDKDEIEN